MARTKLAGQRWQLPQRFVRFPAAAGLTDRRTTLAQFAVMARFDAEERKAHGEAIPPDVELYLKSLTAGAIKAGGVTDLRALSGHGRARGGR